MVGLEIGIADGRLVPQFLAGGTLLLAWASVLVGMAGGASPLSDFICNSCMGVALLAASLSYNSWLEHIDPQFLAGVCCGWWSPAWATISGWGQSPGWRLHWFWSVWATIPDKSTFWQCVQCFWQIQSTCHFSNVCWAPPQNFVNWHVRNLK